MLRARFLHLIMSHAWAGNRTRVGGVTGERANHYTTAPLLCTLVKPVPTYGFRSEHSCESQLISFTKEVYDNLENGNQTDIIIMDVSKAFDKVDHNKLIYK